MFLSQIIPLHLPPGDTSTERTVYINGLTEQIDSAKELINDVINGVSHWLVHWIDIFTFGCDLVHC